MVPVGNRFGETWTCQSPSLRRQRQMCLCRFFRCRTLLDSPRGPRDELKHVGKRRPRDTVGSNEPTPDTIIAPLKATVPLLLSPGKDALPSRSPRSPLPSPAYLSSRRRASQRMASAAAAELPSPRPCPRPSGWFVEAADAVADAAAIDPSAAEGAAACVQAKNPSPLKHNAHASEKLPAPASASPLGTMRPSDLEVDPLAEQKPRFSATRVDDSPFIRFKPPQHAQVSRKGVINVRRATFRRPAKAAIVATNKIAFRTACAT